MPKYFAFLFLLVNLSSLGTCFAQTDPDSSGTVETSPDAEFQPLADTANSSDNSIREVPQQQVDSWVKNPVYAYANDPAYWKPEPTRSPGWLFRFLNNGLFGWALLILIFIIVLYGIYLLAKENSFSWVTRKSEMPVPVTVELQGNPEIDFEFHIRKFQQDGNYRMAIRYLYLRLIHTVRERGGLSIRNSSTNAEIMQALGNHPEAFEFRRLSTAYEYIFYGSFLPERELFEMLKNRFEIFQQKYSV